MDGAQNSILGSIFFWVLLSVALFAIGLWLRRSGKLGSRGAALIWAVITIAPLFGAGLVMFTKHQVERATGDTQAGRNNDPTVGPSPAPPS